MCLIFIAYRKHRHYPLVVAANRDEFHERPTAAAAYWEDAPDVLAGRDLRGGGTWLGVTPTGRFAAVTNYRNPAENRSDAPSRGLLVSDYLKGKSSPRQYLQALSRRGEAFNGLNLLVADHTQLCYYSNRSPGILELDAGVYGLSNHLLDTPWPKIQNGKRAFEQILLQEEIAPDELLELLANRSRASDPELPDTGIGTELERRLSSIFITGNGYGTRSSTALLFDDNDNVAFLERTHDPGTIQYSDTHHSFRVRPPILEPRAVER
jgi:uncharacterized protein with NRDE domain